MAQITGIFRIGRDAELRYTQGGKESGQTDHGRAKADGCAPAPRQTAPQQSGRFDDLGDDIPF